LPRRLAGRAGAGSGALPGTDRLAARRRPLPGLKTLTMCAMPSVTLSDVAREAGVSLATASRAINGSVNRTVRPELQEKVLAAAARLGYSPDATAPATARGRPPMLGTTAPGNAAPS